MDAGKRLTLAVVAERHLTAEERAGGTEAVAAALQRLTRLRLERLDLVSLDALDALGAVSHLFLQHNRLADVEDVLSLSHLRFLTLASNRVRELPSLQ